MAGSLGIKLWRRVPHDPARHFGRGYEAEATEYTRIEARIRRWGWGVNIAVLAIVVGGRVGPAVDRSVSSPWPVRASLALAAVGALAAIVGLPLRVARLRWERRIGRSTQSAAHLLRDRLVGFIISWVLLLLIVLPALWLVRNTSSWWLASWGAFMVLAVAHTILAPMVIFPLFDHLEVIDDEAIRRRLLLIAREAGVAVSDAYTADASRRTTTMNAYVLGWGPTRRVVVNDNALEAMTTRELEFLLAHEVAHIRRHDVARQIASNAVTSLLAFAALGWLHHQHAILEAVAGVESFEEPGAAPILAVALLLVLESSQWFTNVLLRASERGADLAALEFTRDPDAAEQVLSRFAVHHPESIRLDGIAYLRSSHPPLAERLEIVDRWRASRQAAMVFTDIVDSTATVERIGDRRWYELLRDHELVVRSLVDELGGTVVKDTGDGFLLEMPDAGAAALFAVRLQRGTADVHRRADAEALRVRIGLHCGEVIRRGDDLGGREVHLAARVAAVAGAGEIVVSDALRAELEHTDRFHFSESWSAELKGIDGSVDLSRILWRLDDLGVSAEPTRTAALA